MANDTLDIASLGTLSPEMYAEQQALNRKQQLAQMLMSQGIQGNGQQQGQMVSGHYVAPSPLQSLVPLAQMAAGKYAMDKGDTEAIKLAATLRQEKGAAMNKFRELASNPETMPQAMAYLNDSPYLGDLAKTINAPRTRKVDEDFIIPGVDGKSIVLDKGKEKLPTSAEEAIYNLGLPRDRSTWTKEQETAFKNFIPLEKRISLQQANLRLADEGIGGVAIPGAGGGGTVPMANALRGNPTQAPQSGPQIASNLPSYAQSNPQFNPQMTAQAPAGISSKGIREANNALYAKQLEYQKTQMPADLQMAKNTLNVIDEMLGDTRVENGKLTRMVKNEKGELVKGRETHPGFDQYVGATWRPFAHMIEGTDPASFKALYDQVHSQAFMDAFGRLKGGGQITEIEGDKATKALLRAQKSQSEVEFVKAMREFEENVRNGMASNQRKGMVQVTAAPQNPAPVAPAANKMPRYNPATKQWE